jgi:transcription elongation factor Elf1
MSEERKSKKAMKPKRVQYINGKLGCQRCSNKWTVVDLNPERKAVQCPVCSFPNDIREAIKRAL